MLNRILPTDRLPHGWQVAATLLGVASIFTLCWYLSEKGLLDLAATGLTFFVMTVVRLIGPSLQKRAPAEFKGSAALLDQLRLDYSTWVQSRKLASQVVIAFVVTVAYLVGRYLASLLLQAIASPWLALALGLMLAAAVASPVLVKGLMDTMRRTRKDSTTGEPIEN